MDLDGDGRPEILGNDDRFAYAFAAYAFGCGRRWSTRSRGPVRLPNPRLPDGIRADIAGIDQTLSHGPQGAGRPAGRSPGAWRTCTCWAAAATRRLPRREVDDGDLEGDPGPSGEKFGTALQKFLQKTGYIG